MSSEVPERQLGPDGFSPGCQKTAVVMVSTGISILALFMMLISFMPTNYDGDPEMPDFSDQDGVFFAFFSSGISLFLATVVLVILRKHKSAWIAYLVFAALNGYRFVEVAPHFQG
ncbi:hypothetical protein [Streptosporangium roseum]|uniref:hypothetical protein n=1 Tax=Streptosporangium roseum TaxID=2001 RepID=UPI0012DFCA58|nr:hypothetical protein [Streptosporangium roseum]